MVLLVLSAATSAGAPLCAITYEGPSVITRACRSLNQAALNQLLLLGLMGRFLPLLAGITSGVRCVAFFLSTATGTQFFAIT